MDKYLNFDQLKKDCRDGVDFQIQHEDLGTPIAIFAPHGGGIDLGSSEIAEAIAGTDLSFYLFQGVRKNGNKDLHIGSERFDEPTALMVASTSEHILAIHSCQQPGDTVYVGGLNGVLKKQIANCLNSHGFTATTSCPHGLEGQSSENICNRGVSGKGVQLEICEGLRQKMFGKLTSRKGRTAKTKTFTDFINIIRKSLGM